MIRKLLFAAALVLVAVAVPILAFAQGATVDQIISDACANDGQMLHWAVGIFGASTLASFLANFHDRIPKPILALLDVLALNLSSSLRDRAAKAMSPTVAKAILPLFFLAGVVSLSACAAVDTPQKVLFTLRSSYDSAVLAPAAHYNELPRCGTTTEKICSDAKAVDAIRKADASAKAALDAAETVVRNNPGVDAQTFIAAAQQAVNAAIQIVAIYGVK